MDDIKKRLNSLEFRLALAMSVTMLIAAISIGAIGYESTFRDAHQLQDDHLRDIASMVNANRVIVNQDSLNADELEDPDNHVVVQLISHTSVSITGGHENLFRFPDGLKEGMQTIQVQQTEWRVFVKAWPASGTLVVGQKTEARDEIARHAGRDTLMRILWTIPLLILLMTLTLRWMLSPLKKLSAEMNLRTPEDTRTISDRGLPSELVPFISSTNIVLEKIALVLDQQRRFVADAAHELRSPLTALTLQTKNLALQEMSPEALLRLGEFERGIQRANDLVDQLMTMARVQLAHPQPHKEVVFQQVVRTVFEELMPYADQKTIQLSFRQNQIVAAAVSGISELDWMTLLRNLVDNAIRYSAPRGKVEVVVHKDDAWMVIEVHDNGPGIVLEERARVFDPFYRILGTEQSGSGLGLSIVKNIVATLCGEVRIDFADAVSQTGTVVTVRVPHSRLALALN